MAVRALSPLQLGEPQDLFAIGVPALAVGSSLLNFDVLPGGELLITRPDEPPNPQLFIDTAWSAARR